MGKRRLRVKPHQHVHRNKDKTCHMCKGAVDRKARKAKCDNKEVVVCRACIDKYGIETIGK